MLMCAPSKAVGACAQGNPPKQAGMGDSYVVPHQPVLGVSDFPSLLIQNRRSHQFSKRTPVQHRSTGF